MFKRSVHQSHLSSGLINWIMNTAGLGPGIGDIFYAGSASGNYAKWLVDGGIDGDHISTTHALAYAKATSARNDVIILAPESHSLTADPAWSKSQTHILGMHHAGFAGQRVNFSMASDYGVAMATLSGVGCKLSGLYMQHGYSTGHVAIDGLIVSGNYTLLDNIHINSPISTGLAAATDYAGALRISGTGFQTVRNCTFGNFSVARSAANPLVTLGSGTCTLFENCIFMSKISETTPYFFTVNNASGLGFAIFKGCQFLAMSDNMATKMAVAFNMTGGTTWANVFDINCTFNGVANIGASGKGGYFWNGPRFTAASADEFQLISLNTADY
jgi:hypothetical protein